MPVDSMPVSTKKAVLRNIAIIGILLIGLTAFSNSSLSETNSYIDQYDESFVIDQDGYFTKTAPVEFETKTQARTKEIEHIIGPNETISEIAALYGLKTQTILWENNVNPLKIRSGQKLIIPPFDGISYTVKAGDTVASIAKKYGISADDILAKNDITSLVKGEKIYLPNAKPLPQSRDSVIRSGTTSRVVSTSLANSNATPNAGRPFIFPTLGVITQGFHRGHYAIDIANPNRPPVWAAGNGVVEKVSVGTWGGGYGNHVVIKHPNGLKTLYAHLESVSVSVGQQITQGQVIGRMGRTGRVRGATGIHLHFEVIDNGVKKVPSLYY